MYKLRLVGLKPWCYFKVKLSWFKANFSTFKEEKKILRCFNSI